MAFLAIDRHNMKFDNNKFDTMNQFIQDDTHTSSEEDPRRQSRSGDYGTYDTKPLDLDCFQKY